MLKLYSEEFLNPQLCVTKMLSGIMNLNLLHLPVPQIHLSEILLYLVGLNN